MPYTSLDDIRAGMPGDIAINDQSFPTAAWVTEEILGVDAQIDAAAKKGGLSLPITDTSALGVFRIKGAREVRYQIMAIRAAAESQKVSPLYFEWHKEFTEPENRTGLLEQLEDEGIAGLTSPTDLPWSSLMDANPEDSSDSKNPEFTKDYVP